MGYYNTHDRTTKNSRNPTSEDRSGRRRAQDASAVPLYCNTNSGPRTAIEIKAANTRWARRVQYACSKRLERVDVGKIDPLLAGTLYLKAMLHHLAPSATAVKAARLEDDA